MNQPDQPRVALVTGASRGIGVEISRQLADHGLRVIVACRDPDDADRVAHDLANADRALVPAQLDVLDPANVRSCIRGVLDRERRIDVLVNNAGITDGNQHPADADPDLCERVWKVNVAGPWHCATAVIPAMKAAGYGRIVNMSSTLGSLHHMDSWTEPAYRISKTALNALTRTLAADLADTGVLVNSASPGWVRTDMGGPRAPRSAEQGADTPVWLATLPSDGPTGGFYIDRHELEW